jgi:hypothetical protein
MRNPCAAGPLSHPTWLAGEPPPPALREARPAASPSLESSPSGRFPPIPGIDAVPGVLEIFNTPLEFREACAQVLQFPVKRRAGFGNHPLWWFTTENRCELMLGTTTNYDLGEIQFATIAVLRFSTGTFCARQEAIRGMDAGGAPRFTSKRPCSKPPCNGVVWT